MSYKKDPWKSFGYELDSFERSLKGLKYKGAFASPESRSRFEDVPNNSVAAGQIATILSPASVGPPHGFDLLNPIPLPKFPQFPATPTEPPSQWDGYKIERADKSKRKLEELRQQFEQQFHTEEEQLRSLRRACSENDIPAIRSLMQISHVRHLLPKPLSMSFEFELDRSARIALCTVEIS